MKRFIHFRPSILRAVCLGVGLFLRGGSQLLGETQAQARQKATPNPWRTMPHHGMTPHVSGTTLSAQARYAAGVREILECWFAGRPIRDEYLIVDGGKLAGTGAHSYTRGEIASVR
jgi:hypothetical protein